MILKVFLRIIILCDCELEENKLQSDFVASTNLFNLSLWKVLILNIYYAVSEAVELSIAESGETVSGN